MKFHILESNEMDRKKGTYRVAYHLMVPPSYQARFSNPGNPSVLRSSLDSEEMDDILDGRIIEMVDELDINFTDDDAKIEEKGLERWQELQEEFEAALPNGYKHFGKSFGMIEWPE